MDSNQIKDKIRQGTVEDVAIDEQVKGIKHCYRACILRGDKVGSERLRAQAHALLERQLDIHASLCSLVIIATNRDADKF